MMNLVMTTNNSYDCVLLVDENDVVLSRWDVDQKVLENYLQDGALADQWHIGEFPTGFDPEMEQDESIATQLRTITAYGEECGRNGIITDPSRRQFWHVAPDAD